MDSTIKFIELASSGLLQFIIAILTLLAITGVFVILYLTIRDFQVFWLEKKYLDDELNSTKEIIGKEENKE